MPGICGPLRRLSLRTQRGTCDWILDQIEPRALALAGIQARAAEVSLSCFWVSAHGHGGPSLLPGQMQRLAALNLPLWFDIYFDDDEADA